MSNFSIESIQTKEQLNHLADLTCVNVEDKLKDIIRYYTIARYLTAVFEAHNFKIPVQVWNEYRNSLDHFIRSLVATESDIKDRQLRSTRGHLLRACLDIIKLLCTSRDDWYKALKKSKAYMTYALVDNGNFLRDLEEKYELARRAMINAKTCDIHLGNDDSKDSDILDLYLNAYFAYENLYLLFHEKQGSSIVSNISYYLLYIKANITTMLFSAVGKLIAAIIIFLIGRYWDNMWVGIKSGFTTFFSSL